MKKFLTILLVSFIAFLAVFSIGTYYFVDKINNVDETERAVIEKNPELKPPDAKEEVIVNTLFMGVDKSQALADVMILISYNKNNSKITMLSIPRDTWVNVPNIKHHKINSVYGSTENGTLLAMDTVSNLLGVPIHYYATVDFTGVERIIDILGGVKVYVPMNMDYEDPTQDLYIHLKKGEQVLAGSDAIKFVRFRSGYKDQDLGRIRAQQQFIKAFVEKLTSPSIIPKAFSLLNEMSKCVKTNMTEGEMAKYALKIAEVKIQNISMYTLPGAPKNIKGGAYFVIDDVKLTEVLDSINKDLGIEEEDIKVSEQELETIALDKNGLRIEILNSTKKNGLGTNLKNEVESKGYKVEKVASISGLELNYTRIIDRHGNKDAIDAISHDTGISIVESDLDPSYTYDVTIIVGKDRQ